MPRLKTITEVDQLKDLQLNKKVIVKINDVNTKVQVRPSSELKEDLPGQCKSCKNCLFDKIRKKGTCIAIEFCIHNNRIDKNGVYFKEIK